MAHWQPIDWMFLGYSLMWGALVLYMVNLQRRQAALQRDLLALEAAVGEAEPALPPDAGSSAAADVMPAPRGRSLTSS